MLILRARLGYLRVMDVLLINPGNRDGIYQGLGSKFAAIEPPTWALLLAESVRVKGFKVGILDINAENLTDEKVLERIQLLNPAFIIFVVYGQNVNAGITSMSGVSSTTKSIKQKFPSLPISIIGSYPQALPKKCLEDEKSIDFVFTNEGVYALAHVLELDSITPNSLAKIRGIAYRDELGIKINKSEELVPTERMDIDLPGYAWDLLPFAQHPLDLYRSPLWHGEYDHEKRSPYAAIQSSLGCLFACTFCMINIVNRNDEVEIGVAGNYSKMRFWSPEFMIKQFDILAEMGVRTIRIVDEMFLLNRKYYIPLCEKLATREYAKELRMWAYSRIDTVGNTETLTKVRAAGIKWLALGIESAVRSVRLEISKGKFEDVDIENIISRIHDADIEVMANFIVGLPGEDHAMMQKTLDLSKQLCTSGWNMYPAMALPGSQLYKNLLDSNSGSDQIPKSYEDFSFFSTSTTPLSTEYLSSKEVLKFRDNAFTEYHTFAPFLDRIERIFGKNAREQVMDLTKVELRRNLLES